MPYQGVGRCAVTVSTSEVEPLAAFVSGSAPLPTLEETAMRLVRILSYLLAALAGLYLLAVVLYAIPMVSGAIDDTMEVKLSRPDPSIVADYHNGLAPGQRETFYHLSQGSEILPWILLTSVDVADSGSTKPFVENLERFGLLPDPGRKDGLPVGLTVCVQPLHVRHGFRRGHLRGLPRG